MGVESTARKCALLLHLVGPDIADLSDSLPEEPDGQAADDDFVRLKTKLTKYLVPTRNVVAERGKFQAMAMEENEDLEVFLGRLRAQVQRCGYTAAEVERELRDRCVLASRGELQQKLVREAALKGAGLTLEDVRRTARAFRDVKDLAAQLAGAPEPAAAGEDTVQALRRPQRPEAGRAGPEPGGSRASGRPDGGRRVDIGRGSPPGGRSGGRRCFKCGDTGHLKRDCPQRGQVASVEEIVMAVDQTATRRRDRLPLVTVSVNGRQMEMLVDTGSPVSIVAVGSIPGLEVRPSVMQLRSFTGQPVPVRGEATVDVLYGGQRRRLDVVVSSQLGHRPLLGRDWLQVIRLDWRSLFQVSEVGGASGRRTLESVKAAHAQVFADGLGVMSHQAHLTLKPGAVPRRLPPRPVPYALLPQVEAELDRWVRDGIARKVDPSETSSGWGTPLVPVPKPGGGVRLCASYNLTVNPQLIVKNHPLPKPEDVFAGVSGKLFCKLDLKHAYQQMPLDEESQPMTTVSTHKGEFVMRRLPFGVASSGALFQEAMDRVLEGQDGCRCYLDDLLVFAEDEQQLLQRLDEVLGRLERQGLRLAAQKCQLAVSEVEFLGWKVTADGIAPTDGGVAAVLQAPEPKDVSQLRSLLGSITYFGRLLPDLSTVLAPLYRLTKKGVQWEWSQKCAEAVNKVKQMLTSPPVLMRYDPDLPLKLVTDASSVGVGAALVHVTPNGAERPVMYASRTLTATERKYAQVEREAAAVSYGVSRFHRFIYGRRFTLVVDNRALSRILSPDRDLPSLAAARLQRYALQLAAYSYNVELRRSEQMHVADSLSRLAVPCSGTELKEIEAEAVTGSYLMFLDGVAPALTARELAAASRRDLVLAKVLAFVRGGWPATVEPELEPFRRRREELTTDGECLVWGGRVVVPRRLQAAVMRELHEGHLGSSKMKNLARRYVWWPGLDAELEGLARDCVSCAEKRSAPPRSELHPWEPAGGPWERIHIDYAGPFHGNMYLIVYDSYTKWLEAVPMRDTGSEATINELRAMFARFGIPRQVVSDNGPQFTAAQFVQFLALNGVRQVRVAPYHPSSNGAAERAVQTAKNGLKAALRDGGPLSRRLQKFLLAYRAAPHAVTGRSPAEMLLGRNVRTRLDLLRRDPEERSRDQQQRQWSAAGGQPRKFNVGDAVWARNYGGPHKWRRGAVAAQTGPVSYEIDVGSALWSRHADQLLAAGPTGPAGTTGTEAPDGSRAANGSAADARWDRSAADARGHRSAAVAEGGAGEEARHAARGGGGRPDERGEAGAVPGTAQDGSADEPEQASGATGGGARDETGGRRRSERRPVPPKRLIEEM
ncbi:uncharacterized protein K02A2.6-like [Amphibalanus amphitrite]|uniref:uncharacterized protein K02A2.6-like n=1 Tax=Amphibalanus amphitrite TaxID=1232801 RepID=UPI001C9192D2|nr:uncharacterized protein K02A2.6-like [Amphibalanus amphitrite]